MPGNAGGAKGPDFWCAFEDGEVVVIGDEPENTIKDRRRRRQPFRHVARCRRDLCWNSVCPRASPLARRQAREGEEAVTRLLPAVSNPAITQPPPSDRGPATVLAVRRRGG